MNAWHDVADIIRVANIALAAYYAVLCIPARRHWSAQPETVQLLLLSSLALVIVTGWASIESLWIGVPPGPRVGLLFLVLAHGAYAITRFIYTNRKATSCPKPSPPSPTRPPSGRSS